MELETPVKYLGPPVQIIKEQPITVNFQDVHVYEARNHYWVGEILKGVCGASLYLTTHTETPWGFNIN